MDTLVVAGVDVAGLTAALTVRKEIGDALDIKVVGAEKTFAPPSLLPDASPINVNFFLSEHDIDFVQGSIAQIRSEQKELVLEDERISYDYLVVATGKQRRAPAHAIGVDGVSDVQRVKERVKQRVSPDTSVAVVGAGSMGVEMAAFLDTYVEELSQTRDVRRIDVPLRVFERAERVLPDLPERASEIAGSYLERNGVEIVTDEEVTVSSDRVRGGEDYAADVTVWCGERSANVAADVRTNDKGEVVVNEYMQSVTDAVVYAVGGAANFADVTYDGPRYAAPGNQVRQGRIAGWNIASLFTEDIREEYEFYKAPIWINLQKETLVWWRDFVLSGTTVSIVNSVRQWWDKRSFTV